MTALVDLLSYDDGLHRQGVISLWEQVFAYPAAHNHPEVVIDKKLAVADDLFVVACRDGVVVGTVLGGYDGHRGWIYSLAVHANARGLGLGSRLLQSIETRLLALGCLKINLQVVEENAAVTAFYERHGYMVEPRVSMGKRLFPEHKDTHA